MNLQELLSHLDAAAVRLESPEPGRVILVAVFPETHTVPAALVEECRRHKPELAEYLAFAAEADHLLLESTARLAEAWPKDCTILDDDGRWWEYEHDLSEAYWSLSLPRVEETLKARERYALAAFESFRQERQALPKDGEK